MIIDIPELLIYLFALASFVIGVCFVTAVVIFALFHVIDIYCKRIMRQCGVRDVIQFGREYKEWKRGKNET